MRETMDKPPENGESPRSESDSWSLPRPARPPMIAGEVSMRTVLHMPLRRRLAAEFNEMVRQAAERLGVAPGTRFSWVPLAMLVVGVTTLLLTVGMSGLALARSYGADDASKSSDLRALTEAVAGVQQTMGAMRGELSGKIDGLASSVATQNTQIARLDAELKSANKEIDALRSDWRVKELQMQKLERKLIAAGVRID